MKTRLTGEEVRRLRDELCIKLGICLAPALQKRLPNSPPTEVERFAKVIYQSEGLDPALGSDLYKAVFNKVSQAFEQHEEPPL